MAIPDLLDTWNRLTEATLYGNPGGGSGSFVPDTRAINTTPPLTGGGDLSADRTLAITLTGGGSGAVGTGRTIATTAPLTGGGDLSADRTLALTTSPASQTPVGVTRSIATTAPLAGGGDLSADRTLTVAAFTGAVDGIVTHNPSGVQGKFLKDDNTWATSAVAGVTSVTGVAPVQTAPTTGDVFVAVAQFTTVTAGTVPATGAAGSNSFACADGTWKVPGTGGFVTLQGSTPGTADVGSAHVNNTIIADTRLLAGSATTAATATVESLTNSSPAGYLGRSAGTGGSAYMWQQRARGTLAAPSATLDADELAAYVGSGYSSSGHWTGSLSGGMIIRADGNASTTRQASLTDVVGGDVGNFSQIRMTGAGVRVASALGSISTAARAKSTLDVVGSLNLKRELFSGAGAGPFAVGATSCIYIVDTSTSTKIFTLPTAVGIEGRIYGFIKASAASFGTYLQVNTTGGQLINGISTTLLLNTQGEGFVLISDGSNWWTLDDTRKQERASNPSDIATVANTVVETTIAGVFNDIDVLPGAVGWQYYAGKFSTTGTPTLRFRSSLHGGIVLDSTALTMPNNATAYPWMVEIRTVTRTVSSGDGTGRVVKAILHIGSATGALTPYSMLSNFGDVIVNSWGDSAALLVTWGTANASNTITATCAEGGCVANTMIV